MWVAGWVVGGCCFGWRFPQPAKNARTWETGKEWKESAVDSWKQAWLHTTHGKSLQKQRKKRILSSLSEGRDHCETSGSKKKWRGGIQPADDCSSSVSTMTLPLIAINIWTYHDISRYIMKAACWQLHRSQSSFDVPRHSLHLGRRLQQRPSFGSARRGPLGRWHLRGCLSPPAQRGRRGELKILGNPGIARGFAGLSWFIIIFLIELWRPPSKVGAPCHFWTTPFGGIWFNRWSVAWFRARGNPTRSDGLSTFPLNQFSERVN